MRYLLQAPAYDAVTMQLHYMMAPFLYAVVALLMVLLCIPRIISQNCAAHAMMSASADELTQQAPRYSS